MAIANTIVMTVNISKRKQHHIDVCSAGIEIEGRGYVGFDQLHLLHCALPELSWDDLDTSIEFLGIKIALPLFISCMTGGSDDGRRANQLLARAAQEMKIPLGLGSMRVLLEEPSRIEDFNVRKIAPDIPLLANFGAVQLRDSGAKELLNWCERVDANCLVIHLNCGQELFQERGDRDFRHLFDAIASLAEKSDIPIIVKETGFGIAPRLVGRLLSSGVTYVDLAGAGGTNWILVENSCRSQQSSGGKKFAQWGIPTPPLLASCRQYDGKILASGGVRSGIDLAKSIALGAVAGGMALPLLQAALKGGEDAVLAEIEEIAHLLRASMMMTGSKTIAALRDAALIRSAAFVQYVAELQNYVE